MADHRDLDLDSIVCASLRQMSTRLDGEMVVLNFADGRYYSLDTVGARIWELLQEPRRVSEIRDAVLEEFEVDDETCRGDLLRLLGELQRVELVETRHAIDA